MNTPEIRPMVEVESGYGGRYSTLSELSESDFKALFDAYMRLSDIVAGDTRQMTLGDFLQVVSSEADNRGYFD